jgi:flagellin-like hook-associated protein FlgL
MNVTGYPGYDRTTSAALRLRDRLDELTRQSASGHKADSFGGLGGVDARRSVSLRAELARHETLAQGVSRAATRATVGQSVLERLGEIATQLNSSASSLLGLTPGNARLVADAARAALQEVAALLNERVDGEYLFNGSDTANPPVPDAAGILGSDLVTSVRAAVAGLDPTNGDAIAQAARDAAKIEFDTSLFSAHLSTGAGGSEARRSVPVAEGVSVDIGLFANRNAYEVGATTPSDPWALDLLHGLSVLASLGDAEEAQGPGFEALVSSAVGSLRSATDKLAQEQGVLGGAQARLDKASAWHKETLGALELDLASVEGVDMVATLTALQATRTQLEASYQSLSMLGDLSLVNFLR